MKGLVASVGIADSGQHRTTCVMNSGPESGGRKFAFVCTLTIQDRFSGFTICIALLEGQEWDQIGQIGRNPWQTAHTHPIYTGVSIAIECRSKSER